MRSNNHLHLKWVCDIDLFHLLGQHDETSGGHGWMPCSAYQPTTISWWARTPRYASKGSNDETSVMVLVVLMEVEVAVVRAGTFVVMTLVATEDAMVFLVGAEFVFDTGG